MRQVEDPVKADSDTGSFRATVHTMAPSSWGFNCNPREDSTGVLEDALAQVTQAAVRVIGSGRTDSGVHARGQVVGFRATGVTRWRFSIGRSTPCCRRTWRFSIWTGRLKAGTRVQRPAPSLSVHGAESAVEIAA